MVYFRHNEVNVRQNNVRAYVRLRKNSVRIVASCSHWFYMAGLKGSSKTECFKIMFE